jgi:GDP-4-dehydro-6-deoxy-D-mannose reductase
VSKLAQDYMAYLYSKQFSLDIIRMRPFLVVGPKKNPDVCSHFAIRISDIEKGKKDFLGVGNLKAVRDFVDIRDAITAMELMMVHGKSGDVFNLCSGQGLEITEVLNRMIRFAKCPIKVVDDPHRLRPLDEPFKVGDCSKLQCIGWKNKYTIDDTLLEILNYWRTH